MSRKDYRLIADAIRELKDTYPEEWESTIAKISRVLKKDNPRFSERKFWDYIEG